MKNKRQLILTIALSGIIFGCASEIFAQNAISPVGGYTAAAVTDKDVVAATNYALRKQTKIQKSAIKLVAINNATQQVVAGMNYQLCLSVKKTDRKAKSPVPQTILAVVYQDLKGKYKLESWAIAACTDATPVLLIK